MTGKPLSWRRVLTAWLLVAVVALSAAACQGDGQFTVLGYTTKPNYDESVRTVHVPIFKNLTFWKGLEFDLTRAVVREIEQKTPFKVVGTGAEADTELTGTITVFNKAILNRNQLNEVREAETTLIVEVLWRDLRTGEILSQTGPAAPLPQVVPGDPNCPPGPQPVTVRPVVIQSVGHFIPELGQSLTSGQQQNVDRMAVQIVSMMEKPW